LAVEEQFYFIWPALLALLVLVTRNKRLWMWLLITLSASSFIAFVLLFAQNQPLAFFSMPTRAWQFGAGALIYFLPRPQIKSKSSVLSQVAAGAGLVFIIGSAYVIDAGFDNEPLWALPPTLGACMIIWAGQRQQGFWLFRLLASQPLVHIGTLSYSLYLWHWPVIVFLTFNSQSLNLGDIVLALVLTYVLSWFSYRYIESRLRKQKQLSANSRSFLFGALLILTGLIAAMTCYFYAKQALTLPAQQKISTLQFASEEANACVTEMTDIKLTECELGDVKSDKVIVVFGDSKAQQWLPILSDLGLKQGWKIVPFLKTGCSPLFINPFLVYLGREYQECNTWRDSAIDNLSKLKPELIFVIHYSGYAISNSGTKRDAERNDWLVGAKFLAKRLQPTNSHLLYLRDTPQFPVNVPKCLSRAVGINDLDNSMCAFPESEVKLRGDIYDSIKIGLKEYTHSEFIDLSGNFCTNNMCPSYADDVIRFTDKHHLSLEFTKQLSPIIEQKLISVMTLNKQK
jgi:hypothetical protein